MDETGTATAPGAERGHPTRLRTRLGLVGLGAALAAGGAFGLGSVAGAIGTHIDPNGPPARAGSLIPETVDVDVRVDADDGFRFDVATSPADAEALADLEACMVDEGFDETDLDARARSGDLAAGDLAAVDAAYDTCKHLIGDTEG